MKVRKKPLTLRFRFATETEVIETLEGPVTAHAGDAVLTGVRGEAWPISAEKFCQKYEVMADGQCVPRGNVVDAQQMLEPFVVRVGWANEPLKGQPGDYLLTYGPGDFGVVERAIFEETYEPVCSDET